MGKHHSAAAKSKKISCSQSRSLEQKHLTSEQLSEFAYRPTVETAFLCEKPFGSQTYKHMKSLLMQRVSPSRYTHSLSVAKTARKLARAYGHDERVARMAGLLHDWDKALHPNRLADRVNKYQLSFSEEIVTTMPWLLHGPTAAAVLADEFPCFGEEVFQAIERHTVGAPGMTQLDMIVFVADKIEPLHEVSEYERLYKNIGKISLDDLFFAVLKEGLAYLVRSQRPICHDSVEVWNWYCAERSKKNKGE